MKIVLECITGSAKAFQNSPIQKAAKFLPKWWVDLAKKPPPDDEFAPSQTMRGCVGMRDLYSHGLMIPMWTDFRIEVGATGVDSCRYQFADPTFSLATHDASQRGDYLPQDKNQHIKLLSPWWVRCEEDIKFLFSQPTWNMSTIDDYSVLPGVVDFKYQHATNINIMLPRSTESKTLKIPFGQPVVHIIPLDDRPIELKFVLDEDLSKRLGQCALPSTFTNSYKIVRAELSKRELNYQQMEKNDE